MIEKHPDIYNIVVNEGVLDLVCECTYPENEDEANADLFDVESASSHEDEILKQDGESSGFLMFSQKSNETARRESVRRVSRRLSRTQNV